jgi:hypothetical protein
MTIAVFAFGEKRKNKDKANVMKNAMWLNSLIFELS